MVESSDHYFYLLTPSKKKGEGDIYTVTGEGEIRSMVTLKKISFSIVSMTYSMLFSLESSSRQNILFVFFSRHQ